MSTRTLPPRTLTYISLGASEGQRNEELLAAAVQCRDAGNTLGETEQLLIPRAVADGLSEHEAQRTIASAYARSAREPIAGPPSQTGAKIKLTPEARERIERQKEKTRLMAMAAAGAESILREFSCGFPYYSSRSPENLLNSDPREDWKKHLRLFKPDDVVWIGETYHSAADDRTHRHLECARHFQTVDHWLAYPPSPEWHFTCPSVFKPGSHSRCDANVVARPYLVLESDTLNHNEVCAVFRWVEQFTRLRAIVDTAGKSLHGWFEMPPEEDLAQLAIILPALGCDPALFRQSQPCRIPGAYRDGRYQSLLYLDLGGLQ